MSYQNPPGQQYPAPPSLHPAFFLKSYLVRKKIFTFLGGAFHIYDPNGQVVFYSKQKAFKLREDIRIYTGEDMQKEVLLIKARNIIDFSAVYDVFDSSTNERVGALKREGLSSIVQDKWNILNAYDQVIGIIQEESLVLGLVRRFVTNLIPQTFIGTINNVPVCEFRQNFNPFVVKINLDFSQDTNNWLDRRLGIAAAILLCAIEGKQAG
jgi:uncharacterized protein YxjI